MQYPSEDADANSLRLHLLKGGRLTNAIPEFKGLALMSQIAEWLRQDAAWLDHALADEPDDAELDIRQDAVWERTEEGDAALERERQRVLEGLRPRHVRQAGWGE